MIMVLDMLTKKEKKKKMERWLHDQTKNIFTVLIGDYSSPLGMQIFHGIESLQNYY